MRLSNTIRLSVIIALIISIPSINKDYIEELTQIFLITFSIISSYRLIIYARYAKSIHAVVRSHELDDKTVRIENKSIQVDNDKVIKFYIYKNFVIEKSLIICNIICPILYFFFIKDILLCLTLSLSVSNTIMCIILKIWFYEFENSYQL